MDFEELIHVVVDAHPLQTLPQALHVPVEAEGDTLVEGCDLVEPVSKEEAAVVG